MKKEMTKEEKRKRFAPLQAHEDKQRATWFSIGAGFVLLLWIFTIIL